MRKPVTPAPAVAVDTAVCASPVYIHSVTAAAAGQYSFGIYKMHRVRTGSIQQCLVNDLEVCPVDIQSHSVDHQLCKPGQILLYFPVYFVP